MESTSEVEVQEESSIFTCEICIEPIDSTKRFQNKKNGCPHDSYCVNCIANYIESKIQEYNTADIKCPGENCNESLDPLVCRTILPSRVFDLWCDALSESVLSKDGVFRSYCPASECSTPYFSDCKNIFKVTCLKCNRAFCFKCKVPWTYDHECLKDRQKEGIADTAFEGLVVQKKWGRCPKCGYVVERRSGCTSMNCRCGTTFCYNSGKVVRDHECHCNGCRQKFRTYCCCCCGCFCVCILVFIFFIIGLAVLLSR